MHPNPDVLAAVAILTTIFTFGAIIAISVTWLQSRAKIKAIEVLKTYAEKGQEPPPAVADSLARINWPFQSPPGPPSAVAAPGKRQTRADHLSSMAGAIGLALGADAVIVWRWPLDHEHPGGLMIFAVIVSVFFTASAAARLVGALTTHDGDR